jgi:4-diphosphocytidyl-2-C-methyl-D-erythritol kinase
MSLRSLYDVPAPAKLNLFLHVVGKRADGYHLLQSAFVLLDWHDTLHFERRSDGNVSREDLNTPLPEDDLCLRAANALKKASGTSHGAHISIHKELPSGAGLGGGSSDAATTLLALNRLWGLNWPRAKLQALALPLGADVPFFIGGHNAWVEGIGEQLTPIDVPQQRFSVIKPPTGAETRRVFSSPLLAIRSPSDIVTGFPGQQNTDEWGQNDLQAAAEAVCPEIAQALRIMSVRFGHSRMTGSGSAVFSKLNEMQNCSTSAVNLWLESLPAGWLGRVCVSQAAHPLMEWAAD